MSCKQCGNNDCCSTFCSRMFNVSCNECPCEFSAKVRKNTQILAGQLVAFNSLDELVPFLPNAQDTDLDVSNQYAGISTLTINTDANGKVTNIKVASPFANACNNNLLSVISCGKIPVEQIKAFGGYTNVDFMNELKARHLGVWQGKISAKGVFRLF